MVVERLQQEDAQTRGWLLDGYPRSGEQAEAIEAAGIRPDVFILINVIYPLLPRLNVSSKANELIGIVEPKKEVGCVTGQYSIRPSTWSLAGQEHEVFPAFGGAEACVSPLRMISYSEGERRRPGRASNWASSGSGHWQHLPPHLQQAPRRRGGPLGAAV